MGKRRIYHPGHPYHRPNSIRGVRRAKKLGYNAIDLDMQITKDGRIVCTHWPRPMLRDGFRDPLRPRARRDRVADMPWSRVRRLVVPRGGYRIQPLRRLLAECKAQGITAVLEPKGDPRFHTEIIWKQIRILVRETGADVVVYALPQNAEAIPPARRAGFTAWELG